VGGQHSLQRLFRRLLKVKTRRPVGECRITEDHVGDGQIRFGSELGACEEIGRATFPLPAECGVSRLLHEL